MCVDIIAGAVEETAYHSDISIHVHDRYVIKINRPSVFHYALVRHLDLSSHYSLHRIILSVEGAFTLRAESEELILKTKHTPSVVLYAGLDYSLRYTVVIRVSSVKIKSLLHPTRNAFNNGNKCYWTELNFLASGIGGGRVGKRNHNAKWTTITNPKEQLILSVIRRR